MKVLVDGSFGIHVPQRFAKLYPELMNNEEDHRILLSGPEHEEYWEAWDAVLLYCEWLGVENGRSEVYSLLVTESGDILAVNADDVLNMEL